MGTGIFQPSAWDNFQNHHVINKRSANEIFSSSAADKFDPLNITYRESCESDDKPKVTPVIIALDVTGSMGEIPKALIRGRLGELMKSILERSSIPNPHVMFMAVGDVNCDQSPLQVTQFEADIRIAEQLKDLYLEGGGGGNGSESYPIAWYFAANKTQLDSFKNRQEKGIIFTIGDDYAPQMISCHHLRRFVDSNARRDMTTGEILEAVKQKYDVFHLGIKQSQTYTDDVKKSWNILLGERHITVNDYNRIDETIVSTIDSLLTTRNRLRISGNQLQRLGFLAANAIPGSAQVMELDSPPAYQPPSSSYRMGM